MQVSCTQPEEVVKEEDKEYIDLKKGDWVSYAGTKFGMYLLFQGEGLFLGTRKVHGHKHLAFLGEDNKETVLIESWNSQGRLYKEVE